MTQHARSAKPQAAMKAAAAAPPKNEFLDDLQAAQARREALRVPRPRSGSWALAVGGGALAVAFTAAILAAVFSRKDADEAPPRTAAAEQRGPSQVAPAPAAPLRTAAGTVAVERIPTLDRKFDYFAQFQNKAEFEAYVRRYAEDYRRLVPSRADEETRWQRFTINVRKRGVDAVIFALPVDTPADIVWGFAMPEEKPDGLEAWGVIPMLDEPLREPERFVLLSAADWPGLSTDEARRVRVQALVGEIQPHKHYLLWFKFHDETPRALALAMRLAPVGMVDENDPALVELLRSGAASVTATISE